MYWPISSTCRLTLRTKLRSHRQGRQATRWIMSGLMGCWWLGCTGSCTCSLPDQFFWNTTADQCTPRQSSGGNCQSVGHCLPSKGLDCLDTNGDVKVDTCACPDPTNQYWDASLNRCNCLDLAAFYWDSTTHKCLAKKLYGVSCSATLECQTNYFLNCISGVCKTVSPGYKTTGNIYTGRHGLSSFGIYSSYLLFTFVLKAYKGCYADSEPRDLSTQLSDYGSHDSCVNACKNSGFKFAGCQNGWRFFIYIFHRLN